MTVHMSYLNDKATMSIRGRFDFNIHEAFRQGSEEALAKPAVKNLEVNLREVVYLDSSALGMLLLLRDKSLQHVGTKITLSGSSGIVAQVLEVANFSKLFTIT